MRQRQLLLWAAAVVALGVVLPVAAHAQVATVGVATVKGSQGGQVRVPITVTDPSNMGALHVELTYDQSVVEAKDVVKGGAAANALVDFNVQPGRVLIGLVSSDAITTGGDVVVVTFDVLGASGTKSELNLENMRAWQGDVNRFDIKVVTKAGEVTVAASSFLWWIIVAAAVLLLLLLLLIVWRRRSRRGSAPPAPPTPVTPTTSA